MIPFERDDGGASEVSVVVMLVGAGTWSDFLPETSGVTTVLV